MIVLTFINNGTLLWQVLTNIGLTKKEAKIYLTLLTTGAQPASIVAKKAGLNRTTTYLNLEELKNKGLVNTSNKGKLYLFQANDPACLEKFIESEKQQIMKKEFLLQNNIPYIKRLIQNNTPKPKAETHEGFKSVQSLLLEMLRPSTEICCYFNFETLPPNLRVFFEKDLFAKRLRLKIPIKIISDASIKTHKLYVQSQNPKFKSKIKIIDQSIMEEGSMFLTDNKTIMLNFNDEHNVYGNLIENNSCSKILHHNFQQIWNQATD